ncbi:hypothetical protein DVH24_013380 [Malus domestica]|nr:hypothetical protein DVH24_013380 [Malus domestica]
MGIIRD